MVMPLALGEIFFEAIEATRDELCPDGSLTSAIIGIAKAWPRPCILIEAALGHKKRNSDQAQTTFGFTTAPAPTLRAVNVTINEAVGFKECRCFAISGSQKHQSSRSSHDPAEVCN
jgi:hypothetical protein